MKASKKPEPEEIDEETKKYLKEEQLLRDEKRSHFNEIKLIDKKLDVVAMKLKPYKEKKMAKNVRKANKGLTMGKHKTFGNQSKKDKKKNRQLQKGDVYKHAL
jgi:hypothetical protein